MSKVDPACVWPELEPHYARSLRAAIRFIFESFQPVGIVVAGSIVRGTPDRSSDFDIQVLHEAPFKQRIQRRFEGIPTEIFINPAGEVRSYFETEHRRGRPSAAHMFATGHTLFGPEVLAPLQTEAKEWLARRSPFTHAEDTWQRYAAACVLEDAEDIADRDPAMANALLSEAVLAMLRYRVRIKSGAFPAAKRLLADLALTDEVLARSARLFFCESALQERIALARAIAETCVGAQGFFEWDSEPLPAPAVDHSVPP